MEPTVAKNSSKNTGLVIGGSVFLGLLIIIFVVLFWWYFNKRKKDKGLNNEMRMRSSRTNIITTAPKIQVNAVEFSVPFRETKGSTWSLPNPESSNEGSFPDARDSGNSERSGNENIGIPTCLGLLRPELYTLDAESVDEGEDFPANNIGRVWFRIEYNCDTENLYVTLINIKNLPARQTRGSSLSMASGSTCDPFVRIYLLPDEKRFLQSKMKKKTRNPRFEQTFAFSMSYSVLIERTLRFTVFDVDRFTRQTIIGHALYSLQELDITMTTEESLDLEKLALPGSDHIGGILVTLTFFSDVNRMAVTLSRATDLQLPDVTPLNPYAKITLSVMGKALKTKKTNVHKDTLDPDFNRCFEFKVNPDDLEKTCLTIELMHSTSPVLKQDKLIGKVYIGGPLVSRGKELEHWTSAVSRSNSPVKEWHDLKR